MNKAIIDNKVLETKAEQEAKFAAFAKAKGNTDYEKVVSEIDAAIEKSNPKVTILKSGLEGLGIAAYEKFKTPLTNAVENIQGSVLGYKVSGNEFSNENLLILHFPEENLINEHGCPAAGAH